MQNILMFEMNIVCCFLCAIKDVFDAEQELTKLHDSSNLDSSVANTLDDDLD